jgi:hypothetical protein
MKRFSFSFILFFVLAMFLTFNVFGTGSGGSGGTDINNTVIVAPVIAPVTNTNIDNKPVFNNVNAPKSESNSKADAKANSTSFSNSSSSSKVDNDINVKSTNVNINEGNKNNIKVGQELNFAPVTITPRDFVNPGSVNYPGLPTMNIDPGLGVSFQPYTELLMFKKTYTESELRKMAAGHGFQKNPLIRVEKFGPPGEFKSGVERPVTFICLMTELPVGTKFRQVMSYSGAAESKKGNSSELLGRFGVEVIESGGNYGYIFNQGHKSRLISKSLGFSLNGTGAQMSDNGDKSQTITPGSGLSIGSVQMPDYPWLRGAGLYVQ